MTGPLVQPFHLALADRPCKYGGADKSCQEKSYRDSPEGRRITLTLRVIVEEVPTDRSVGS